LKEYRKIIEEMRESDFLRRVWKKYKEENTYSEGIKFKDTLDTILEIGIMLEK